MPLTGEYEPSGLDWSQKQVAKIIESGTTDGITIAD
ncbi:MAG: nitroreductase family deazaflavin-dependent oxidoreductase, partial [[Mycobacterium] stephanolepidis]